MAFMGGACAAPSRISTSLQRSTERQAGGALAPRLFDLFGVGFGVLRGAFRFRAAPLLENACDRLRGETSGSGAESVEKSGPVRRGTENGALGRRRGSGR